MGTVVDSDSFALRISLVEVDAPAADPAEVTPRAAALLAEAVRQAAVDALDELSAVRIAIASSRPSDVLYRTVDNVFGPGLVVCLGHVRELAAYRFAGSALRVRAIGARERGRALVVLSCRLCETPSVDGNVCRNDDCGERLHPRWPAVYCSDECALADR